jgi:predicted aspartyl protease
MPNDMGTFRVDIEIENPARPGQKRTLRSVLVDTGAELSWVPAEVLEALGVERNNQWRFRQANGTVLERWAGTVSVYVAGKRAGDEVVFGEPGDLTLLGSRTLEGLNFRVEPRSSSLTPVRHPRRYWSPRSQFRYVRTKAGERQLSGFCVVPNSERSKAIAGLSTRRHICCPL